jgi:hypothetical protein
MSAVGAIPQAWACRACARPISPPPGRAAALLLMFCDLNGATRQPSWRSSRHRPAASQLLPTCEAVP